MDNAKIALSMKKANLGKEDQDSTVVQKCALTQILQSKNISPHLKEIA